MELEPPMRSTVTKQGKVVDGPKSQYAHHDPAPTVAQGMYSASLLDICKAFG